jgi:hypothetical protein
MEPPKVLVEGVLVMWITTVECDPLPMDPYKDGVPVDVAPVIVAIPLLSIVPATKQ